MPETAPDRRTFRHRPVRGRPTSSRLTLNQEAQAAGVLDSLTARLNDLVPFAEGTNEYTAFVGGLLITFFLLSILLSIFVFESPRPYWYANLAGWAAAALVACGWMLFIQGYFAQGMGAGGLLNTLQYGGAFAVFVLVGGAIARRLFGLSYQNSCTMLLSNVFCTSVLGILIYYASLAFSAFGGTSKDAALPPQFIEVIGMWESLENSHDLSTLDKLDRIDEISAKLRSQVGGHTLLTQPTHQPTTDYDRPIVHTTPDGLQFCIPPDSTNTPELTPYAAVYRKLSRPSSKTSELTLSPELLEILRLFHQIEHDDTLTEQEKLQRIDELSDKLREKVQ